MGYKNLIIVILTLVLTSHVLAKCLPNGFYIFPNSNEISQNGLIVIQAYGKYGDLLNGKYDAYLEAKSHSVKLETIEAEKGIYGLFQAILRPTSKLLVGKTYTLKIIEANRKNDLLSWKKWSEKSGQKEPISWRVNSKLDTQKPTWKTQPKLIDKKTLFYGCGPVVYAIFDFKVSDASQVLVKTELYDMKTKKTNVYFLFLKEDGKLKVGHGMCNGAFYFEKNRRYKARFSLLDASGNANDTWSEWIEFDSPYEEFK